MDDSCKVGTIVQRVLLHDKVDNKTQSCRFIDTLTVFFNLLVSV